MADQPLRILFLCTHNRCRSILAEALTRHLGQPWLVAASAGSSPEGQIHPDTLQQLDSRGIDVSGLHSKSWHDMAAFEPDYTVAVCQQAAGETCPLWMQNTPLVAWALPDPSRVADSDRARQQAFADVISTIQQEIEHWVQLLEQGPEQFHAHMSARGARRNSQSLN